MLQFKLIDVGVGVGMGVDIMDKAEAVVVVAIILGIKVIKSISKLEQYLQQPEVESFRKIIWKGNKAT